MEQESKMSIDIDIRYITNGTKNFYYVRKWIEEDEKKKNIITIYDKKEDIPENIRHYIPSGEPYYLGPEMARLSACQEILYPDFPKMCGHPKYIGDICIAECCKYAIDGDWTKCPYFE